MRSHRPIWFAVLLYMGTGAMLCGEEHRLLSPGFLDIGNRWNYHTVVTEFQNVPFEDVTGNVAMEVAETVQIGTYSAAAVQVTGLFGQMVQYWSLQPNGLLDVGYDTENQIGRYRAGDPLEVYPVWLDSLARNLPLGTGEFTVAAGDPPQYWTEEHRSTITFLRRESVAVPAGEFECTVVRTRQHWDDSDGWQGHTEETVWFAAYLGIVRSETHDVTWNPEDQQEYHDRYTMELTSSILVDPHTLCAVRPMPLDLDGDCRVALSDLSVLAAAWPDIEFDDLVALADAWLDCHLSPQDACWQ